MEENSKMIKVKKPKDPTNFNKGYRIVAVSEELAVVELGRQKKHTQWIGVEVATKEDIKSYGYAGETLEVKESISTALTADSTEANAQLVEANQMIEMTLSENEQLKKELAEIKAKQKIESKNKEEGK